MRAKAYDLVLDGIEIGGGSIRIHDPVLQRRIFRPAGDQRRGSRAAIRLVRGGAQYGTPPHGGIALGLDRMVALLLGETSIRDVIAFPKTAEAVDLMTGAPASVDRSSSRS